MEENNKQENTGNKKLLIIGIVILVLIVGVVLFFSFRGGDEITGEVIGTETSFEEEELEKVRPFIITTLNWEPHIYLDERGIIRGIGADVLDNIFSELGVSYEVKIVPWARALKEAENGEADAILFTAYTPERDEFLYYTKEEQSQIRVPFPPSFVTISDPEFFVRKLVEDSVEFDTLEEIVEKGYRVGVVAGYSSAAKLYDAQIEIIEYPDPETAFQALADGEIDLYLVEKAVGFSVLKRINFADKITAFSKSFFTNPQYIPFSKKSDYPNLLEFREQFLEELRKMHESGEYDEIYNSYIE